MKEKDTSYWHFTQRPSQKSIDYSSELYSDFFDENLKLHQSFADAFKEDKVVAAAQIVEGTIAKDITSGISEEVIAYGLVHALSKQAEAIVGESELPLIKMTPSMLTKIEDHALTQLKSLKDADWGNRDGKRKRLVRFFEALVSLTER